MHVSRPSLELSSLDYNGEQGLLGVGHFGRPFHVPEGPCGGSRITIPPPGSDLRFALDPKTNASALYCIFLLFYKGIARRGYAWA